MFCGPGYIYITKCFIGTWNECVFCCCWEECSVNIYLVTLVDAAVEFYSLADLCPLVSSIVVRYLNFCLSGKWKIFLCCISLSSLKIKNQIKYFPSSLITLLKTCHWDFTNYSNLLLFFLFVLLLFYFYICSDSCWHIWIEKARICLHNSPCISLAGTLPQPLDTYLGQKLPKTPR